MTAQGSRRTAALLAIAALAFVAWRSWPNAHADEPVSNGAHRFAREGGVAAASTHRERVARETDARSAAPLPTGRKQSLSAACDSWEERRTRRIREALEPARSAKDAFAHALMTRILVNGDPRDPDAERREMASMQAEWQAARRRWPGDIDIAWLAARNCSSAYDCNEEEAEQHLVDLDGGNAAAWILAMAGAERRRQSARYESDLAHAADAGDYAPRTGNVFRALQPL
jgi:hypothetical protein